MRVRRGGRKGADRSLSEGLWVFGAEAVMLPGATRSLPSRNPSRAGTARTTIPLREAFRDLRSGIGYDSGNPGSTRACRAVSRGIGIENRRRFRLSLMYLNSKREIETETGAMVR